MLVGQLPARIVVVEHLQRAAVARLPTSVVAAQASSAQGDNAQAAVSRMSAEQIIAIMQQQPGLLATMKAMIAQQTGVAQAPSATKRCITKSRRMPTCVPRVTTNLNQLGYSTNATPESNATKAAGAAQTRRHLAILPNQIRIAGRYPRRFGGPSPYGDCPRCMIFTRRFHPLEERCGASVAMLSFLVREMRTNCRWIFLSVPTTFLGWGTTLL